MAYQWLRRLKPTAIGLGLGAILAGVGCNWIADIEEGKLTASGTGGEQSAVSTGTAGMGGGGQGGVMAQGGMAQGGSPCVMVDPGSSCEGCLATACEEEFCGCVLQPDCIGLIECLSAGNPAEVCNQQHSDGISTLGLLQGCGAELCPDCGLEPVDACTTCQYLNCAKQLNACHSIGECPAFFACYDTCLQNGQTAAVCSSDCASQYPEGASLAQDLSACAAAACGMICSS